MTRVCVGPAFAAGHLAVVEDDGDLGAGVCVREFVDRGQDRGQSLPLCPAGSEGWKG